MRARTLTVLFGLAGLSCGPGGGSPHESDGWCGDGVVDADEACDDANTVDGDGCSATCEVDYPDPSCVSLIETVDAVQGDVLVTDDGRLLVTGQLVRGDGIRRAWVGAYDLEGQEQWSIELDDNDAAGAITQTKDGFVFTAFALGGKIDIITIDNLGNTLGTYTMLDVTIDGDPNTGVPYALLDTSDGLLLGGTSDGDLWLARLGDEQLTTLVHEDHVGFRDAISRLRRHGDTIVALAVVGVANHGDGDSIEFDTLDTWFIEYDEQGEELRKTVLSSGDDRISTVVHDLELAADDTWVLAGQIYGTNYREPGGLGWAAGIREGEILWTIDLAADVELESNLHLPNCSFVAVAASIDVLFGDILLGGQAVSREGVRRWAVRLDPQSGTLLDEIVGAPVELGPDGYNGGAGFDGYAAFVGSTREQEGVEQWLCKIPF